MKNPMRHIPLDTLTIAYAKLYDNQNISSHKLGELCKFFGIKNTAPHRALGDARATFEVYKKLLGA